MVFKSPYYHTKWAEGRGGRTSYVINFDCTWPEREEETICGWKSTEKGTQRVKKMRSRLSVVCCVRRLWSTWPELPSLPLANAFSLKCLLESGRILPSSALRRERRLAACCDVFPIGGPSQTLIRWQLVASLCYFGTSLRGRGIFPPNAAKVSEIWGEYPEINTNNKFLPCKSVF